MLFGRIAIVILIVAIVADKLSLLRKRFGRGCQADRIKVGFWGHLQSKGFRAKQIDMQKVAIALDLPKSIAVPLTLISLRLREHLQSEQK
eukprot:6013449-Amphidinium_carterae.1